MAISTSKSNAEKLAEAEDALHDLNLGNSVRVFVDQNGERVEYTAANSGRLRQYVEQLKQSIAAEKGTKTSGPLRMFL